MILQTNIYPSIHMCIHAFFYACILATPLLQLLIRSLAMSISDGHASMTPAPVSDFDHLYPQQNPFAPNHTVRWQQPQHQQHMQHKQLQCPPIAVPPGCWPTHIPGFSPHLQQTIAPVVHDAIGSDFWAEKSSDSLDRSEPVSPVYVPPINPSILIQFMLSPDYSLLKSNPEASYPNLLDHLSGLEPGVFFTLDHNET